MHLPQATDLLCFSFPPPKIFANALLSNHDITSLIRDTEAHERALFSVPPPPKPTTAQDPDPKPSSRRRTIFNVTSGEVTTGPPTSRAAPRRQNAAVAAVLGGDLHAQIRRGDTGHSEKGDVDVEVLLRGAEKLCGVYALPGALERIPALRNKYAHLCNTMAYYEAKVAEQTGQLESMNRGWIDEADALLSDDSDENMEQDGPESDIMTDEELRLEEEEVRELERKKRELQETLRAMDRDLGGLLHM